MKVIYSGMRLGERRVIWYFSVATANNFTHDNWLTLPCSGIRLQRRVPTQTTKVKFQHFRHYKSQEIMTYSSTVVGLLTRIWQQKTTDIKLPVPIIDAKQCSVSQLYTNYIIKKYFVNGLLYQDHILKFHNFFSTYRKCWFRTFRAWKIKRQISGLLGPMGRMPNNQQPPPNVSNTHSPWLTLKCIYSNWYAGISLPNPYPKFISLANIFTF